MFRFKKYYFMSFTAETSDRYTMANMFFSGKSKPTLSEAKIIIRDYYEEIGLDYEIAILSIERISKAYYKECKKEIKENNLCKHIEKIDE